MNPTGILYSLKPEDLPFLRSTKGRKIVRGSLPSDWRPGGGGKVFVVGDASALAVPAGAMWSVFYDGKTRRRKISSAKMEKIKAIGDGMKKLAARNPRGTITQELWAAVGEATRRKCSVFVKGEEDLASLALIARAPLGSVIVYGLPGRGLCVMKIRENNRKIARRLISPP